MTKEERNAFIKKMKETCDNYADKFYKDIIFEPQENQKEHFDKLPKVAQIALMGLYNDLRNLCNDLYQFKSWFINNNY